MHLDCTHYSQFEDIEILAVAISRPRPSLKQQHAGIIFRDDAGELKLLDLQWHYSLSLAPPTDSFVWLDVPLDDISKTHLATICQVIADLNKEEGIPYSISTEGASILHTGEFFGKHLHSGFTCATFVLAIFESQGFRVVDYRNWISRPSDKKWQLQIIQNLQRSGATPEYIAGQVKQLSSGADRFRPEEVCAAISVGSWPAGYEETKEPAAEVLEYTIKHATNTHV